MKTTIVFTTMKIKLTPVIEVKQNFVEIDNISNRDLIKIVLDHTQGLRDDEYERDSGMSSFWRVHTSSK